jgi:hypothetical protein
MALTYGFKTARDLLAKLQREHGRLKEEVSGDNCGFSKFCHLFSLNSVTPRAVTPSSRVGWGAPPL